VMFHLKEAAMWYEGWKGWNSGIRDSRCQAKQQRNCLKWCFLCDPHQGYIPRMNKASYSELWDEWKLKNLHSWQQLPSNGY
jgi:hypothetical protein